MTVQELKNTRKNKRTQQKEELYTELNIALEALEFSHKAFIEDSSLSSLGDYVRSAGYILELKQGIAAINEGHLWKQ